MHNHVPNYYKNLWKVFNVSSLNLDVSFLAETYVHGIDFDYIQALEHFLDEGFQVMFFLQERRTNESFGRVFLQMKHEGLTYWFRIEKNDYQWQQQEYEIDLLEVTTKSNVVFTLRYAYSKDAHLLPLEQISFVSNQLRVFEAHYRGVSESKIAFSWNLAHFVSDFYEHHSFNFYRDIYEERKQEQEWRENNI